MGEGLRTNRSPSSLPWVLQGTGYSGWEPLAQLMLLFKVRTDIRSREPSASRPTPIVALRRSNPPFVLVRYGGDGNLHPVAALTIPLWSNPDCTRDCMFESRIQITAMSIREALSI